MKPCKKCGQVKPLEDFYRAPGAKDGRRGDCKSCNLAEKAARNAADPQPARDRVRRWQEANPDRYRAQQQAKRLSGAKARSDRKSHLKRKYGLTVEEYDERLAEQGGGCAICKRTPEAGLRFHVDHDHRNGRVRGLLCQPCNNALGLLHEDPALVHRAQQYVAVNRLMDTFAPVPRGAR